MKKSISDQCMRAYITHVKLPRKCWNCSLCYHESPLSATMLYDSGKHSREVLTRYSVYVAQYPRQRVWVPASKTLQPALFMITNLLMSEYQCRMRANNQYEFTTQLRLCNSATL